MASQSAVDLLGEAPAGDGRIAVRVRLSCGCELALTIDADRLVTLFDGRRLAGGKYPCPLGHPVQRAARALRE